MPANLEPSSEFDGLTSEFGYLRFVTRRMGEGSLSGIRVPSLRVSELVPTSTVVGHCENCGQSDILMLFREGDRKANLDCPTCGAQGHGTFGGVYPDRLATEDEIPFDARLADTAKGEKVSEPATEQEIIAVSR